VGTSFSIGKVDGCTPALLWIFFLCHDDSSNETPSERLLFAESLLGEMNSEIKAELDPNATKPSYKPESLLAYLKHAPNDGINNVQISDQKYQSLEQLPRRMLAWKPEERITEQQALNESFFQ
jgi:hypothetical protein